MKRKANSEKSIKTSIPGLNTRLFSICLLIAGTILFAFTIYFTIIASRGYYQFSDATENYISAEEAMIQLQDGSDYLTKEAREYATTGMVGFMNSYFTEANETRSREEAIEKIKSLPTVDDNWVDMYLSNAMEKSNSLMDIEIHSMKLMAEAVGTDSAFLADEVNNYVLPADEKKLSAGAKKTLAYNLVYNSDYVQFKSTIDNNIDSAKNALMSDMNVILKNARKSYVRAVTHLLVFATLTFIVFLITSISIIFFLIRPINGDIKAISNEEHLPYCKSRELNYLAMIYNEMFDKNKDTTLQLREEAEHDALTGLMNRAAFDNLCDYYSKSDKPIALLLLDVDHFKQVNDTYGHDVGDQALKRVAGVLKECFRSNDYTIRFGGDEFAVIMCDISPAQKNIIERKLKYINTALINSAAADFPELTVSAGVSFSKSGYTKELFLEADAALYETKENGRCGYRFFSGKPISNK